MSTRMDIRRAAERLAIDPDDRDALAVVGRAARRAGVVGGVDVGDLIEALEVVDGWLREREPGWTRQPGLGGCRASWSQIHGRLRVVGVGFVPEHGLMLAAHDGPGRKSGRPLTDLTPDAVRAALEDVWREMGWGGGGLEGSSPAGAVAMAGEAVMARFARDLGRSLGLGDGDIQAPGPYVKRWTISWPGGLSVEVGPIISTPDADDMVRVAALRPSGDGVSDVRAATVGCNADEILRAAIQCATEVRAL